MTIVKIQGVPADDRLPAKSLKRISKLLRKRTAKVGSVAHDVATAIGFEETYEANVFLDLPSEEFNVADLKYGVDFEFPEAEEKSDSAKAFGELVLLALDNPDFLKGKNWQEELKEAHGAILRGEAD